MAEGAASSATRFQLCALLLLIGSTTVLCQSISSSSLWAKKRSFNTNNKAALFVFGDSLYDPGNNNYITTTNTNFQANFRPYGKSYFSKPTGRVSDGRLIPDFICEYAGLQLIPPYLQPGNHHYLCGANFASAGAGALDETHPGLAIYKTGGRKFSFVALPPLGCLPSTKAQNARNKTHREDLTALVQEHNKAVSENLDKLEKQLKGFMYSFFDFYTTLNDRMISPSKYGFKNGDSACCGSGPYRGVNSCGGMREIKEYEVCKNASEYLFFDSGHPSEVAYQQLAKLMWEGSSSITGLHNLQSFFES